MPTASVSKAVAAVFDEVLCTAGLYLNFSTKHGAAILSLSSPSSSSSWPPRQQTAYPCLDPTYYIWMFLQSLLVDLSCLTIEPNFAERFHYMSIRLYFWTTGPEKIPFPHLKCIWTGWTWLDRAYQVVAVWVRRLSRCGCTSLVVATEMSRTTVPRVDLILILFMWTKKSRWRSTD